MRQQAAVGCNRAPRIPSARPDLETIDDQKARIVANTRQFVARRPANNVLLTGARGSGKSSLVRPCSMRSRRAGLRLIEVDKGRSDRPRRHLDLLEGRPERFIIFCDDLSFEAGKPPGRSSRSRRLDRGAADNVLIYATSNRRHLMPEYCRKPGHHTVNDEIHPGETTEEKVAVRRFGLWVSLPRSARTTTWPSSSTGRANSASPRPSSPPANARR